MARQEMVSTGILQHRLMRGVGAHGRSTPGFIYRATRRKTATLGRSLEIENSPGA